MIFVNKFGWFDFPNDIEISNLHEPERVVTKDHRLYEAAWKFVNPFRIFYISA